MTTLSLQATPQSTAPDDRSTTFQPVEGGSEQRSGGTLMVAAYSVIWTLLMVWLVMLWRKQARLNERLEGLEGAIVAASHRPAPAPTKPESGKAEAPAGKLGGESSGAA
jgi:CcmD family protein